MLPNLVSKEQISKISAELKSQGKNIVATNGCFDVLHIGHSRYLQKSKELADVLILGLNSDSSVKALKGESRPINNQADRAELLLALEAVDYVVIFEEENACNFLNACKPDFYTKGGDYKQSELENWPEYQIAQKLDCKIVLIDFVEGKSSTKTIKTISAAN